MKMKKEFSFGKIDFDHVGKKRNLVTVEVCLYHRGGEKTFREVNGVREYTGESTPEYYEFTACGNVWNNLHTDIIFGGQCLDEIDKFRFYLSNRKLWSEIYDLWKKYHLNGMKAGTPEQEAAIQEWIDSGHKYDYKDACEYLKSIGLYEVNFTGKSVGRLFNNEPYKYGHAWIIEDLPEDVFERVMELVG